MSNNKVTYITYNEAIEAKHLHLGNLVHDFNDPNSLDPHVETAYTDLSELPPPSIRSRTLEDFALTVGSSQGKGGETRYHVAAAGNTTQIELKDGTKFFTEVTLRSSKARKWLSSRISAAEELKRPKLQIWMLTGLFLMTHATWTSVSSNEQEFEIGEPAPFNRSGVSAIRRLSVSDAVKPAFGFRANEEEKRVSGAIVHETGKYPGTRGWAARWQKIDVEICSGEAEEGSADDTIKLADSSKYAVVKLRNGIFAGNQDKLTAEDLDEESWDTFLDKAAEYD